MQRKALPLAAMADTASTADQAVELARAYGAHVFRAAYRIVGEPSAAEDIQQEVFVRLLENPPENVSSWPAFLATMATRMAIDQVRTGNRRSRLLAMFMRKEPPRTPEDLNQADELAPALRRALGDLSARETEAFCLRYLSELSNAQVAGALGISENNVSVILHRARAKLARRLALADEEVSQ